jgi:hypothetical protein
VKLRSQLLVLIVERPDPILADPVVPSLLPALVVNFVVPGLTAAALVTGLYVHDFGFVEKLAVEAQDLFVLAVERCWLLPSRRHAGLWIKSRGKEMLMRVMRVMKLM